MSNITNNYIPNVPSALPSKSIFKVIVPMLGFMAGTGGTLSAENLGISNWVGDLIKIESLKNDLKINLKSPKEQVTLIREVLGLNMSELAAVLGIARPTAYAWLEGHQEPKSEKLIFLQKLASTVEKLKKLQIPRFNILIHRPIFDGRSLLDKLKANEDLTITLKTLKELAYKEKQARTTPKGSNKHLHSFSDTIKDHSNPFFDDES